MPPPLRLLALLLGSLIIIWTEAVPLPATTQHSTHRKRIIGGREVQFYHPRSSLKTYGKGIQFPVGMNSPNSTLFERDIASDLVASQLELSLDAASVKVSKSYTTTHADIAYMKQYFEGIPFANTAANVAYKGDRMMSFSSNFISFDATKMPATKPTISLESALPDIETALGGVANRDVESYLAFLARDDGSPSLAHVIQIDNDRDFTHYQAFIDAHSGELLSVVNFVNDATYHVLPITKQALTEGLETLVDPEDLEASPNGWLEGKKTLGNNVITFKVLVPLTTEESSKGVYDYTYRDSLEPAEGENRDASLTNGFYIANTLHDIWYRYGFTEDAGNFQEDNFGKGGLERDRVFMSVQDTGAHNSAKFSTPPDGQRPTALLYLWNHTSPQRDGALENDIAVHEFTHGLTNRLTGGGTANCLQTVEAAGMGEGWSDAFAEWTELTSASVQDFTLGTYVTGTSIGFRSVPYSTNKAVNGLMYSDLSSRTEVHGIGEVWATVLHGVLSALVEKQGFSKTAFTDVDGLEGNVVYLHLFIDALTLQPCNPSMLQARDAWIQADENRYDGEHVCTLWAAFADRGLGVGATEYNDDSGIPKSC